MTEWRDRLYAALAADDRSDRAISSAAGLGPNYISQLRQRGSVPTIDAAERLCETLGISFVYLVTGLPLDREGEAFVRVAASRSAEERRHLFELLRMMPPAFDEEPAKLPDARPG